ANFDYVGELASEVNTTDDGKTITFTLRDGVKFHNGKVLTSADVKYTFDQLFQANGYKAGAFFDTVPDTSAKTKRVPHLAGAIETPDARTVVFRLSRPSLKNTLLSNLVAIPIIPEGSVGQQKDSPLGSGPFKFVSFDASQNTLELAANADY